MTKIRWTKKQPRRSGLYLTKKANGNFELVYLSYCREVQEWWLFNYPQLNVSNPLDDDTAFSIVSWGPKID